MMIIRIRRTRAHSSSPLKTALLNAEIGSRFHPAKTIPESSGGRTRRARPAGSRPARSGSSWPPLRLIAVSLSFPVFFARSPNVVLGENWGIGFEILVERVAPLSLNFAVLVADGGRQARCFSSVDAFRNGIDTGPR